MREINVHLDELLTRLPLATVDALTGVMKHFIIDVDQVARLDVVTDKALLADKMGRWTAGVEPIFSDGMRNGAICSIRTGGVGCQYVWDETAGASQVHMA